MSITLNPALKGAQDSDSHHIIVELFKTDYEWIPFDGRRISTKTVDESRPNCITHSTGRICAIYVYDPDTLCYLYSDTARETFNEIVYLDDTGDLGLSAAVTIVESSIVELADATIGLIFTCYDGSNYYLRQTILSITGSVISNALIDTYAIGTYPEVTSPFCILLASGTYLLIYVVDTSATVSTIYKRTSADFSSWSAEASISISGISTEPKHSVSLCQIDTDDIFLCLDYENDTDITNAYYSISDDDGATWGAAVAITSYATDVIYARHPYAVQKATDTVHFLYDERETATQVDTDSESWPGGVSSVTENHIYGSKLYIVNIDTGSSDVFESVVEIDIPTGAITNAWTANSTPAFHSIFTSASCVWKPKGSSRRYVVIGTTSGSVGVLNTEDNTINHYHFFDQSAYSITANTNWTPEVSGGVSVDSLAWVTIEDNILYCGFYYQDATTRPIEIVSLDLGQIEPTWNVNQIYFATNIFTETDLDHLIDYSGSNFRMFPDANIAVWMIETSGNPDDPGKLIIFDISTIPWTVLSTYVGWEDGAMTELPYGGAIDCAYHLGFLYMNFPYQPSYDQEANYLIYDTTAVDAASKGFSDCVYDDSRYVYFIPLWQYWGAGNRYFGQITRYDTTGDFDAAGSWAVYDTTAVDANSKGFGTGIFDGTYLYLIPDTHGQWTRYNTTGDFQTASNYQVYDMVANVDADAKNFHRAVLAGIYIYMPSIQSSSGHIVRYNTQGTFNSISSYDVFDTTTIDSDAKTFGACVYDGKYIYFAPIGSGHIVKYDTYGSFTQQFAWEVYDTTGASAYATNYYDACFDGRYIYFLTHLSTYVVRYDTKSNFSAASSWKVFNTTAVTGAAVWCSAIKFYGQYVYLIPQSDSNFPFLVDYSGVLIRYNITKTFSQATSWASFDTETLDTDSEGFLGACSDGRYLYCAPYLNGTFFSGTSNGHVLRFDTLGAFETGIREGICKLDISTGLSQFIKPNWDDDYDDYKFARMIVIDGPDNPELLVSGDYGITRYDLVTEEWTLIDSTNTPGLTPDDDDTNFFDIAYYEDLQMIITGKLYDASAWEGLVMTSIERIFSQPKYKINTWGGESWSLGSAVNFITGINDRRVVACLEPSTSEFYVFWQKLHGISSIKWDKEFTTFDLSSYLAGGKDIIIERTIDSSPARLSFYIAKGHLFDEGNILSMLGIYLNKGSKLTLRLGETISGTNFWQKQGTFYIKTKDMSIKRGEVPIMRIDCEDQLSVLNDMELITTSDYYGEYPETIIADILENDGGISAGDIDIAMMEGRTLLYCAWANSKINDIINSLCDRYGYYLRINTDNEFTVKKITDTASIDHFYYDRKSILEYTPDDNFSDFVNRIIVQAEERLYRRIIYPEREVQVVHGTIGWWQGTQNIKIPYADDYSLECLYPYPVMEYLTGNFLFGGNALKWELTADESNKFCTLKLIAPIMIEQLIAALTTALATDWIPIIGGAISAAGFFEIFNILASVSNWSALIRAQPIGYVRSSVQGVANDSALQTKMGKVIVRTLDEPLAYSPEQCQFVADHEMMVTKRQRSRVKIRKIGHLQDEEGDTLKIIHPISNDEIKLFITTLTRRIHIPLISGDEGGIFDDIEGWKID